MNSVEKVHWWQKKSFGLVLAGIMGSILAIPGLPPLVTVGVTVIGTIAGALGVYGFVEVMRASAAANAGVLKPKG